MNFKIGLNPTEMFYFCDHKNVEEPWNSDAALQSDRWFCLQWFWLRKLCLCASWGNNATMPTVTTLIQEFRVGTEDRNAENFPRDLQWQSRVLIK